MSFLFFLEIIGTIAFAISGALVAIKHEMDVFGVLMLGLTTAVGGGVLRDLILGITPPSIFDNPIFIIIALVVSIIVFTPNIRKYIKGLDFAIQLMDALGLAVFTMIGTKTALSYNNFVLAIFAGVLTGVGGGVLRDIFAGQDLYIFVKHFYACAALIGAIFAFFCFKFNENIAIVGGIILIFILRMCAYKYKWNLPKAK